MRTHVDLFSGIGGFALASRACGVRTVQFVEIDQRCRDFLGKAWPGVAIHDDIRSFHWSGDSPWLLTGGVPCQPASRAGKQRGAADDRWLWPEAVRVISECRPAWALFENPPGIGDVGLAGILSAVESEGYEVRVVSLPACAVGAPHRRERYWIICRCVADPSRGELHQAEAGAADGPRGIATTGAGACHLAHASTARLEEQESDEDGLFRPASNGHWSRFVWLPCADGKLRRAPDDSVGLVDGLHRSLLGALGNSIVPQVAERIIRAMIEAEE